MKKTVIIIVGLAVAIFLTAVVLVTTLLAPKINEWFAEDTTYSYSYSMVPTATTPVIPQDTDSWIDINSIAGDLATATDTDTSSTSVTLAPIIIGTENGSNLTSIVYIDQNGNIVDPNLINNNKTTTQIDNDIAFDDTVATTEDNNAFVDYEFSRAVIITEYFGTSSFVIIPSKIQGITVKGIGKACFEGKPIKGVQIPETVSVIEAGAFLNCKKLETVIFKDEKVSVDIGNSAFEGCESLKKINLPITPNIGMSAFENCKSLQELDIKKGTKNVDLYCFAFCESLTKLTIRDDKTTFNGATTFNGCNKEKLIVYCEPESDVELKMKGYNINTSPITG